jgi:hypothetical protein
MVAFMVWQSRFLVVGLGFDTEGRLRTWAVGIKTIQCVCALCLLLTDPARFGSAKTECRGAEERSGGLMSGALRVRRPLSVCK